LSETRFGVGGQRGQRPTPIGQRATPIRKSSPSAATASRPPAARVLQTVQEDGWHSAVTHAARRPRKSRKHEAHETFQSFRVFRGFVYFVAIARRYWSAKNQQRPAFRK
jgi:hypothetical protein